MLIFFKLFYFFLLFSALAPFTVFSTGGRDAQYISLGVMRMFSHFVLSAENLIQKTCVQELFKAELTREMKMTIFAVQIEPMSSYEIYIS